MAIIKGPSGDVTVIVGQKVRTFINYGVEQNVIEMTAANTAVLEDGTGTIVITQQPAVGRMVARGDGRISFDGNDNRQTGDFPFAYTKNGETVNRVLRLTEPQVSYGWDRGEFYEPERDSTGNFIFEPSPDTYPIHVSLTGLTFQDIRDLEPSLSAGSSDNEVTLWVLNNAATGHGDDHYGGTPATAVSPALAGLMGRRISLSPDTRFDRYKGLMCFLFERGQTFPEWDWEGSNLTVGSGYSMLHPDWYGTYGAGAKPYFQGNPVGLFLADRSIVQGLDYGGILRMNNCAHTAMSDMHGDFNHAPADVTEVGVEVQSGNEDLCIGVSLNKMRVLDVTRFLPGNDGDTTRTFWGAGVDRTSGGYLADVVHGSMRNVYVDQCGWAQGYRADRFGGLDQSVEWLPMPPSIFNQGWYIQSSTMAINIFNFMSTNNSLSALQVRSAGTVTGVFSAGNNSGITMGRQWYVRGVNDDGPFIGFLGFLDDSVHTHAGAKDTWDGAMSTTGGGHRYAGHGATFIHSAEINAEWNFPIFGSDQEFGPQSQLDRLKGFVPNSTIGEQPGATLGRNELIRSNWNRAEYPDENVGSVPQAERDALTIENLANALYGLTNADSYSLAAHLRTLNDPIAQMRPILDYYLQPFGKGASTRSTPQTLLFRPAKEGGTPGVRVDIRHDWDTFDLPGDVAGDSVDFLGHLPTWNHSPRNWIDTISIGGPGVLPVRGGAFKPVNGLVVDPGGNGLDIKNGSRVDLPGHATPGVLSVEVQESRFRNTGIMTNTDITARYRGEVLLGYDNANFTLSSGRKMTIYGHSDVGFDGALGGASSLTLEAGSLLELKPSLKAATTNRPATAEPIPIGGSGPATVAKQPFVYPKTGTAVTGNTSGATANTRYATLAPHAVFDDLSGTFTEGETFSGQGEALYNYDEGQIADLGRLTDIDLRLGQIKTFRSGINGFNAPNVNTQVSLGGTLDIDVSSLPNGTYTLIEADAITGTFGTVTAAGNTTKDLTMTTSGTQVQVTITNGTGQVTLA